MARTTPFYRPLTPENLEKIDRAGLRILERVGIRIQNDRARDLCAKAGARVDRTHERVCFDEGWLRDRLGRASSRFTLFSRDGKNDLHLGTGTVYFANGGRVFRILDMATGGYRNTLLRDVASSARLVQQLEHIRLYIIACQAHDLAPDHYHLNDFYHALNHTTKHVMGGCDDPEGVRQVHNLAALIAGGKESLQARPIVSIITNPISPLTIDANTARILEYCCIHSMPVTCAPAPIAGATAPATLAGTLAQMHAEALGAVALAQVFAPGAKVMYGAVPTTMDLRRMEYTMGSVEMALMNAAAVQLARRYHLPIYASAGVTEAKRPDVQSGFEKSISLAMVAMAGADLVHLAAGMMDSGNSISFEQYVIDDEIIGVIHRILAGIRVDDDRLGVEVIEQVGPGGNYVTENHTVRHMMDEFFYPSLCVRSLFDVWEHEGRPSMLTRARKFVQATLDRSREGLLDREVIEEVNRTFSGIQNR